jgi:hypothetical protein
MRPLWLPRPAGILLCCCSCLSGLLPMMAARYGSRPEGEGGKEWDSTRRAPVKNTV